MTPLDQLTLHFNQSSLLALNLLIGLMIYGTALDIHVADFTRIARAPRGPLIGLAAQFLLLPAVTFGLISLLPLPPSVALGMILVAACPGGNLSNVITHLARGNVALSVSMTAVSSLAAILLTPLNLAFWGGLDPATAEVLRAVHLDPLELLRTILLILALPVALGMTTAHLRPRLARRLLLPFKRISVALFLTFVALALLANWRNFMQAIGMVALVVALHNACALALGYFAARAGRLEEADARAVSIEVGIQNSALALALIFTFFDGLGGMAVIAGWWGVWHIIAGMSLAAFWSQRAPRPRVTASRTSREHPHA
jgi:BASS family bile acid:Na+ symporter